MCIPRMMGLLLMLRVGEVRGLEGKMVMGLVSAQEDGLSAGPTGVLPTSESFISL